jgi:hypothetical protein
MDEGPCQLQQQLLPAKVVRPVRCILAANRIDGIIH